MIVKPMKEAKNGSYRVGGLPGTLPFMEIRNHLSKYGVLPNTKPSSDGKTTCEWNFSINGVDISIYDYCGARWSIGSTSTKAPELVRELFFGKK